MTGQANPKIEALRVAANDGLTTKEAAQRVGIVVCYAHQLAKANGFAFTSVSERNQQTLKRLAKRGLSVTEVARKLGRQVSGISAAAKKHGIKFKRKEYTTSPDVRFEQAARAVEFAKLYRGGKTLQQIGQQFGITRERVRQIMTKQFGIRAKDGGKHTRAIVNRREVAKRRDARALKKWGCRWNEYVALRKMKHPTLRYAAQRQNARKRGIGWELNLWQWWQIWQHSGHWAERGRGKGYGMCRHNDAGPYAVDNVYIATGIENIQDYWATNPVETRAKHREFHRKYHERKKAEAIASLASEGAAR